MHFVTVVSATRTPWFFCAALVGPIADASCGIATATAQIPASRRTWRHMMFMTRLLQKRAALQKDVRGKAHYNFFPDVG
jgi:hypothetical protein